MALAVVIIDIRSSVGRPQVPEQLERLVGSLRNTVPNALFQVAWGDEVEGVLPSPVDAWELYVSVLRSLGDLPFYMGMGIGDVSHLPLNLPGRNVHELNGTGFKAARQAVDSAKRDPEATVALAFNVFGQPNLTEALNGYPRMINAAVGQMTRTQKKYFIDWLLGYNQSAIADRHGVRQSTVSLSLQRAGASQLPIMRGGLNALLGFVAEHMQWVFGRETGDDGILRSAPRTFPE